MPSTPLPPGDQDDNGVVLREATPANLRGVRGLGARAARAPSAPSPLSGGDDPLAGTQKPVSARTARSVTVSTSHEGGRFQRVSRLSRDPFLSATPPAPSADDPDDVLEPVHAPNVVLPPPRPARRRAAAPAPADPRVHPAPSDDDVPGLGRGQRTAEREGPDDSEQRFFGRLGGRAVDVDREPLFGRKKRGNEASNMMPAGLPFGGASPQSPQASLRRPPPAYLSPRMTAVFGGLFGLATVTSVIALLIQSVPPRDERAIVSGVATASASAAGADAAKPPKPSKRKARTPIPGPWRVSELEKDPSVKVESGVTARKSLFDALGDKGVPKAQVYRILKAFDGVRKFDKTGRKDKFMVAFARDDHRVKAFEYEVTPSEVYQAKEGEGGLLTATKLDMKVAEEEVTGSFYIGPDLAASYKPEGFEDGLLTALDEAMNGKMSHESFEEGGTVRVIAVEETALGMFSRYKKIIALEVRPADPAGKPARFYHYNGQTAHGYWDDQGRQPDAGGWRSPCPGAPVTSKFNPKRLHPILKKVMPHNGTDFGAPSGTPVYSAYKGVVSFVGPNGPTGNWVAINHPGGIETGYAHLSKFAPGLKVGDKVGTHHLVGFVGSTGRSTGPHLHFSARKNGAFFDAETLHLDGSRAVPAADRAGFLAAKAELDRRLDAIPLPDPPADNKKPVAADSPPSGNDDKGDNGDKPTKGDKGDKLAKADPKRKGGRAMAIGSPSAIAAAAAEPGIHPSKFVEVNEDDDIELLPGQPPPKQAPSGKPNKPDPAEEDGE